MADSRQIILHNLADLADRFLSKEIQSGRLQNEYTFGINRDHIFSLKIHVFILILTFEQRGILCGGDFFVAAAFDEQ